MNLDFLKISALIALVVGFWKSIKESLAVVFSVFIQKIEIKNENTHEAVIAYLVANYKKINIFNRVYSARYESYRNGKYGLVPFEKFGIASIIFLSDKKFMNICRFPFFFIQAKNQSNNNNNENNDVKTTDKTFSNIYCIRGSINADSIVLNSVNEFNNLGWEIDEIEKSNRFNIFYFPERNGNGKEEFSNHIGFPWYKQNQYKILGVNYNELGRDRKNDGKALENLFFPNEIKNLVNNIKLWVKSKEWYNSKNIPWKRGWLLYGPPGTGKTALARAFAEDLDMPLYYFSLPQLSNDQFIKSWQSMQLNIPCIALLEDIDNVFDQRKNICQNAISFSNFMSNEPKAPDEKINIPLMFDTLLNCIDGVDKTDGIFTIITTNDLSKIDSSIGIPKIMENNKKVFISSRPGRIDTAIELTYMTNENKILMAKKILGEFKDAFGKVIEYIKENKEETPAQFQEYCSQIALTEYWNQITFLSDNMIADIVEKASPFIQQSEKASVPIKMERSEVEI